jgi:hypothetical protein
VLSGLVDGILSHRNHFPKLVNRAIDYIAEHPRGLMGRIAARRMGSTRNISIPEVSTVADLPIRVLIAPANYAGQGRLWARSLEDSGTGISARNMAVDVPGGFSFPADLIVPVAAYHNSRQWQQGQFRAVQGFTHVLIEAEEPLFGRLFDRDVAEEVARLTASHVDVAFMCHGTDIRLPSRHIERTPWSPYRDSKTYVARLERLARLHRELLDRFGLPTFVSTPDLLWDVPSAKWCPVVVDLDAWRVPDAGAGARSRLRVAHAPTSSLVKGTELIEPVLKHLHDREIIEYSPIVNVPSAQMPQVYRHADVVLDQFRLGSYGVAACEAMAAGRLVIGHVLDDVRETVLRTTGKALPVLEATADSLESVLLTIAGDQEQLLRSRRAGIEFVSAVHDGRMSSKILKDNWLEPLGRERQGAAS